MSQAAIPSRDAVAYGGPDGLHSHPLPRYVRLLLAVFGIGLLVTFLAGGWIVGQLTVQNVKIQRQAADRAADAYEGCLQRRANAAEGIAAYGDLLSKLQPTTDPAIRGFLQAARDSASRSLALPCQR